MYTEPHEKLRKLLDEAGIDPVGVFTDPSRPTTFKERIIASSHIAISASLGATLPEGWLWHSIIAVALFSRAILKMRFGSADVPLMPPSLIFTSFITL